MTDLEYRGILVGLVTEKQRGLLEGIRNLSDVQYLCRNWSTFNETGSLKVSSWDPGSVYFIRAVGTDRIKIGWTKNVSKRFRQLQTASPFKLKLILKLDSDREMEKFFHEQYSEARVQGEWFLLTPKMRRGIQSHLDRIRDHREQAQRLRSILEVGMLP